VARKLLGGIVETVTTFLTNVSWLPRNSRPPRPEGGAAGLSILPAASPRPPAASPEKRNGAPPARPAPANDEPGRKREAARWLNQEIARLDALLTAQVNAILHHPAFQRLEASWRGLHYLVSQVPEGENIKVRVLDVSWKQLARDFGRALEFDQSQLFRKVYGEEYDTPGGEPFGVLLGDYAVRHRPDIDHPVDDLAVLKGVAGVAAAAFAPFVAAADPALLDLTDFAELELPLNLPRTFDHPDYIAWNAFRESEDARFVGLTLPRVLLRAPYRDDGTRADGFRFREDAAGPDRSGFLWGNAAYAFGAVLARAFAESGWFAAIRGPGRGGEGGGLAPGLPAHSFGLDRPGVAPQGPTDATITDAQEKELGELGFIPLCVCQDAGAAAFYGNQSVQKPARFDEAAATANARLSAMLQYLLCASRFAHYVKVISRDKLGSFAGPAECEDYLRRWLMNYTTANDDAGPELKARHPLREARVQVREHPGKPGSYLCVAHLRPHFQLDQLSAGVKLVTELAPGRST
jgi:type VI secretion system ImpC/EvpB family protein